MNHLNILGMSNYIFHAFYLFFIRIILLRTSFLTNKFNEER